MSTTSKNQVFLIIALSVLMLLTRGAHFSGFNALPEASWMIFMVAGILLPYWSFAWFMSLAITLKDKSISWPNLIESLPSTTLDCTCE